MERWHVSPLPGLLVWLVRMVVPLRQHGTQWRITRNIIIILLLYIIKEHNDTHRAIATTTVKPLVWF